MKTKEELFQYMALPFWKMSETQVKAKLLKSNCKMPFDPDEWDCYIKALTGKLPCSYCGAPRALLKTGNQAIDKIAEYKCVDVPKSHTLMLRTEQNIVLRGRAKSAAHEFMMRHCEHDRLAFDCLICIEKRIRENMEEICSV